MDFPHYLPIKKIFEVSGINLDELWQTFKEFNKELLIEVLLEGAVRSFEPEIKKNLPKMMETVLDHTTSIYGATYEFDYEFRFPPLFNDEEMTEIVKNAAIKILGKERVRKTKKPNMGGEDLMIVF